MYVDLKEFERQALQLPLKERAALAEHLIASLDATEDAECEHLWVEEAERRYQEYKSGTISSRSAEDVFRDAPGKTKYDGTPSPASRLLDQQDIGFGQVTGSESTSKYSSRIVSISSHLL